MSQPTPLAGAYAAIEAAEQQHGHAPYTLWAQLLALADHEAALADVQRAYHAFLRSFPLAHTHWLHLAEHVARLGGAAEAVQVYETALRDATLADGPDALAGGLQACVDVWRAFTAHLRTTNAPFAQRKAVLERAVAAVGEHPHSEALWDEYVAATHAENGDVLAVYERLLRAPLPNLATHWSKVQALLQTHGDAERQATMQATYTRSEAQRSAQAAHEQSVAQLTHYSPSQSRHVAWRRYVRWAEEHALASPLLFERAVLACAHDVSLWFRYARSVEAPVRLRVLQRAARLNLGVPLIHVTLALAHEGAGDVEAARKVLGGLCARLPAHVEAHVRYAAFEKRQAASTEQIWATLLLRDVVQGEPEVLAVVVLAHVRSLLPPPAGDVSDAREQLRAATVNTPTSVTLWRALASLERRAGGEGVMERVSHVYETALGAVGEKHVPLLTEWREFLVEEGAAALGRLLDVSVALEDAVESRDASPHLDEPTKKRRAEETEGGTNKAARMEGGPASAGAANGSYYGGYPYGEYGAYSNYPYSYSYTQQ